MTVDEIYIRERDLPLFTQNTGVVLSGSVNISDRLFYSSYSVMIKLLRKAGVELNRILFVRCSPYDIPDRFMHEMWGFMIRSFSSSILYYACFDTESDKEVAFMATCQDIYKCESIHIAMIETLEKDKGYGSLIVNDLHNAGKALKGVSFVESEGFWRKVGAEFSANLCFELA